MKMPLTLNERAMRVVQEAADRDKDLRIQARGLAGMLFDCGINVEGGLEAGLWMARVCLAGLADVSLVPGEVGGVPCPLVQVRTDHSVQACLASQYAGWQIKVGRFFAMGSGPMRALYGKEPLFDDLPDCRERSPVAVGVLETRKLPDDAVLAYLGEKLGLAPSAIVLLVAPTASQAGTLQVVARSLEMALHKLHELKFDLSKIVSGVASAPLPPVGKDDLEAIGRTNDAILYGGRVMVWVRATDEEIGAVGPKVPSSASPDFGSLFAELFARSGGDFYKIDPMLFSPAQIAFCNLTSGRTQVFGRPEPGLVSRSFFPG